MTIELSGRLVDRLRTLAARQGRAPQAVIEDAVREYLDAAEITDLQPADVAAAQQELFNELGTLDPWPESLAPSNDSPESSADEAR